MTLMYALGGTAISGWLSVCTVLGLSVSAILLTAFVLIERRTAKPLIPPYTWKVRSLVIGTTVMLGITAILVGAVFLNSIYLQNVLGYSALRAGMAFLPFAFAITAGTQVVRHLLGHTPPRTRRHRPGHHRGGCDAAVDRDQQRALRHHCRQPHQLGRHRGRVSPGFIVAAVIAGLIAVVAVPRMSAAPVAAGGGGMHGH
jgi:hypothetical protein